MRLCVNILSFASSRLCGEIGRLKITILTTSFPEYQGDVAGAFVAQLAEALAQQALQVRVIAPHSPKTPKRETLLAEADRSLAIERFQYFYPAAWERVGYGNGLFENLKASLAAKLGLLPFLLAFLAKMLRYRNSTDVYHAQWIISGLVALAGRRIHRKPMVLTLRGSDLHFIHGKLLRALARHLFQQVTVTTTVSEKLRREVLAFGIPADKVITIPNGVNCELFRPMPQAECRQRLNIPAQKKMMLWVARFVPVKGVEFLIQAMPAVLAAEPEALLVLVGGGILEDAIRRQVRESGVAHAVNFAGKILLADIPLWLNAADVFVLPSLSEGRPNVILEAMACELPVVATNVGGVPELVTDGETGWLCPPANPEQLAAKLLDLLENQERRVNMGKAGRQRLFDLELSWEQCARRMKDVYARAAAG